MPLAANVGGPFLETDAPSFRIPRSRHCLVVRLRNRWPGRDLIPRRSLCPPGETSKSFKSVEKCFDQLATHRLERKSFIVALGGGVVGDLAGFVAATYLRGIPFVQVPTTLLAQVDSSVGGKVGVNLKAGKNLVGAFHQPRLVLCDLDTLRTLPMREYRAGLAEVIKYGIIYDSDCSSAWSATSHNCFDATQKRWPESLRAVARSKQMSWLRMKPRAGCERF